MRVIYLAVACLLGVVVSGRKCQNLTIPVTAAGRNGVFNYQAPTTEIDITNYILQLTRHGTNYTQSLLKGYATVSGKYSIAATYCEPDSGPSSALQILTHGIAADRSYWDLPFHNYNYSYVQEAVDQYGYSTFTYDRLGIGQSSHGNPVTEIQANLEVAVLKQLTLMLKGGKINGLPKSFETVVHAGHSFGSQQTYALVAMYPTISDCITLQGWSQNGSYPKQFQLASDFVQANTVPSLADYPNGYLAAAAPQGVQMEFLAPNAFDPAILVYAFKTRSPVTVGEFLTSGGVGATLNTFPGPVHVVTGEHDIPFCGGNCFDAPTGFPNIPSAASPSFTKASAFNVSIISGGGHGLNLEYEHPTTYQTMLEWFVANGCGPKK